jgi:membrane-associated PAP2 superfamily phosphatase
MQGTPEIRPARARVWPAGLLLLAALLLEWLDLDRAVARALFFHPAAHGWIGTGAGDWWARDLIHSDGRWLVRCIAAGALACWALSFISLRLVPWRRKALYVFAGMVLVTATVGLLKLLTDVDCPWDLEGFGGTRPYVMLFADRPDYLPAARCFPGAHSSSGFALLTFYFVLRDRWPRWSRAAFLFAAAVGITFSLGQQARGAHFLSHDLTSAALAWGMLATLHAKMFEADRRTAPAMAGAAAV